MESSAKITAAVFAAHLRCPTEARLLMRGETPSHTFFSDMRKKISAAQRTKFVWRDDLDERAATIRMRKDCRGVTGLPCLIVAGKAYVCG